MMRAIGAMGAVAIIVAILFLSGATFLGIRQVSAAERKDNPSGLSHDQTALIAFKDEPMFDDDLSINDLKISSSIVCEDFNPRFGNRRLIVSERRNAALALAWADWLLLAAKYVDRSSVRWLFLARQNRIATVAYFEPATLATNCRTVSERLAAIDRIRNPPPVYVPPVSAYVPPVAPNPIVEAFERQQAADSAQARLEAAAREGARQGALEAAQKPEGEVFP